MEDRDMQRCYQALPQAFPSRCTAVSTQPIIEFEAPFPGQQAQRAWLNGLGATGSFGSIRVVHCGRADTNLPQPVASKLVSGALPLRLRALQQEIIPVYAFVS
jgi:hypothetical protein